jgi:hypothetical protein
MYKGDPTKVVAYWYFDSENPECTPDNCLRSILRQLCVEMDPLPDSIRLLWQEFAKAGRQPSLTRLFSTLASVIQGRKEDLFVIVDGLDESHDRQSVITQLWLQNHDAAKLHILATSRPDKDIWDSVGKAATTSVDIEKAMDDDVRLFVHHELDKNEGLKHWNDDIKKEITTKLLDNEDRYVNSD